jgi:hypothetical protein
MVKLLLILLLVAYRPQEEQFVPSVEEYISPHEDLTTPVHVTWYINPNGNHTANGGNTFIGSCASNREHLGDVACLYSIEGYFIGYLDCNDTGSAQGLKDGTTIDIYADNLEQIYRTAEEWGTEYYVLWVEADG